jgi:hypothetical protein
MSLQATWGSSSAPHAPQPLWRRLAVRALQATSRWLDARAYELEYPTATVVAFIAGQQVEVAREPDTGAMALYVDGERRFTFLQGLERL